jgi:uncharacterized membrane protein YfcA
VEHLAWFGWLALAASALLIGVSKTGLPGVGILAILITAMVIPAKQSTGLILPMLIVGDIFAVAYYRRHAVWKHLVMLIPFAAIGIVTGWLIMDRINETQLRMFIGGSTLGLFGITMWRNRRGGDVPIPDGWWFAAIIGLTAGVVTMLANAAGPIMLIYLLAMRLPKQEFIGTGAWYYLILNCFKVPFSRELNLISWTSLELNLILLPAIVIGALAGVRLVRHVPEAIFARIVQVLTVAGASWLLISPMIPKPAPQGPPTQPAATVSRPSDAFPSAPCRAAVPPIPSPP